MALSIKPIEIVEQGKHQLLTKAKHWERVDLSNIADVQNGFAFKSNLFTHSDGMPLIRIRDIDKGKTENFYLGNYSEDFVVKKGDILIGMDGDFNAAIWQGADGLLNQRVCRLIPRTEKYSAKFLFLCLQPYLNAVNAETSSVTVKHLSSKTIAEIPLPLPPLPEQHRIVAKIETLFSELDKGIESLKTAREQLKTYRQALLKHAFFGKLTAQWRAENPEKLETASALLKRIQTEREQRYQQQLKDWEANSKQGGKPKPPKTLPPLTAEELAELPELSEGWAWVKFGQIFDIYVGSTPSRKRDDYWNGDIHWVSSGEVAFCRIKDTKEKITNTGYLNASTEIHPVGTVMLAMIGEGKTRGQAAILDIEATHNQNTAAIRVSNSGCPSEFIYQYLFYQYENTRKAGSGNNQKALNKERVSDLKLPLCCVDEMKAVVLCIDEKLSIVDQLDQTLSTALQQAETLRQSILKKAFSGQLVPQDPNDEPASVLLERIQAEKRQLEAQAPRSRSKNSDQNRNPSC